MSTQAADIGAVPSAWTRQHLLDVESLTAEEINIILDSAVMFKESTANCTQKNPILSGRTCANLFFENSTPHADELFAGRSPAGGRHDRFLVLRQQSLERRNVHRHGQEHRGHGDRRRDRAASHARHAASWPRTSIAR